MFTWFQREQHPNTICRGICRCSYNMLLKFQVDVVGQNCGKKWVFSVGAWMVDAKGSFVPRARTGNDCWRKRWRRDIAREEVDLASLLRQY
jgi:hypothetical protein